MRRPGPTVEIRREAKDYVATSGGRALPVTFEARIDDTSLPYLVDLYVSVRASSGPTVDAIGVQRRDWRGPAVSSNGLRAIKVAGSLRLAIGEVARRRSPVPGGRSGEFTVPGAPPGVGWGGGHAGPGRGRPMDDATLAETARVYREALQFGHNPVQAVADELAPSRTTAGRWVHQARVRGFLGPAVSRQAGEVKPEEGPEPPEESPSDTFTEGARTGQRLRAEAKRTTTKKPAPKGRRSKRGEL